MEVLANRGWPATDQFPVNHTGARVRPVLWNDLVSSASPLVVAGFSSIAELVDLIAAWDRQRDAEQARVLLGTEPFASDRLSFASAEVAFTDEVRRYWLEEEGVSLRLSAKVLQVLQALDEDRLVVRFVDGPTRLHAKIYVGSDAATNGSSNFTDAGLGSQIEANTRFERRTDGRRYRDLVGVAENYWDVGQPWSNQFRELLLALLRFVPWQEALARACADLLDGAWAERYLSSDGAGSRLWPSQVSGIAQALWIVENVGSVLVADATGSGKTRMGAHLVRAVRDRLWSTGRVRRDLTVLVCPPPVENTWYREAVSCGVSINTVSHGLLSRQSDDGPRAEELAVRDAQILAVDECHNFLSPDANRTRQVRESLAEHVLLFTATPINRGPADLLQLVGLLGADNFEDETLDVLEQLERRRGQSSELSSQNLERLRHEIQRFTVRRTKATLNAMVASWMAYRAGEWRASSRTSSSRPPAPNRRSCYAMPSTTPPRLRRAPTPAWSTTDRSPKQGSPGPLVDWWSGQISRENNQDTARHLWRRLHESLGSEPEQLLFDTYTARYPTDSAVPALIPQVYLHYDPYNRRSREDRPGVVIRQRMDFLMLLPQRRPIVLKVDGQHHYATDGRADPATYATMVAEDRRLRLAGYEVYRFGGAELMHRAPAAQLLTNFFDQLLDDRRPSHL